jgi:hypothetical protein
VQTIVRLAGLNPMRIMHTKSKIVEEEIDETVYWLELLIESGSICIDHNKELFKESGELTAIFSSISLKLKAKK